MSMASRFGIICGAGVLAGLGLWLAGCEVDSAASTIYITPDSVVLTEKYQAVTLTCEGGYECTWSLATDTWGTLNTRRGNQVVYTSLYKPSGDTPVVQVVTVASKFTEMNGLQGVPTLGGATNVPTTNIVYASAYITHMSSGSATSTTALINSAP
jgi:hypothetical protein